MKENDVRNKILNWAKEGFFDENLFNDPISIEMDPDCYLGFELETFGLSSDGEYSLLGKRFVFKMNTKIKGMRLIRGTEGKYEY